MATWSSWYIEGSFMMMLSGLVKPLMRQHLGKAQLSVGSTTSSISKQEHDFIYRQLETLLYLNISVGRSLSLQNDIHTQCKPKNRLSLFTNRHQLPRGIWCWLLCLLLLLVKTFLSQNAQDQRPLGTEFFPVRRMCPLPQPPSEASFPFLINSIFTHLSNHEQENGAERLNEYTSTNEVQNST